MTMLTEFDTSLPSIRQVQNLIKDKDAVEVKLTTGDVIIGKILWQDLQCMMLTLDNGEKITVWKQAIAYLKPQGSSQ
jgi:host factor-I protein